MTGNDDNVLFLKKALERLYYAVTKDRPNGIEGLHEALAYAALALDAETKPEDVSNSLLRMSAEILGWSMMENEATVFRLNCEMSAECTLQIFVTADAVVAAVLDGQIEGPGQRWGDA